MTWDKEVAAELRQKTSMPHEQIGLVIGIIAEHRMAADREGYKRGFNDGSAYELNRAKPKEQAIANSQ